MKARVFILGVFILSLFVVNDSLAQKASYTGQNGWIIGLALDNVDRLLFPMGRMTDAKPLIIVESPAKARTIGR